MAESRIYELLRQAVIEGSADRARARAEEALRAGLDPLEVMERGCTTALRVAGGLWEKGDLYLPEMMLAAEAAKAVMSTLRSRLGARGAGAAGALCVLGTVEGDIHDIGKNIVATMLEAFGFRIVDLGTDVSAARFVEGLRDTGATLLGLSALLTSTMPAMKTVVEALEEAGLRSKVRIAVGGAPVSASFAREIGADGFAEDAGAALRLFQVLAATAPGLHPVIPARGGGHAL